MGNLLSTSQPPTINLDGFTLDEMFAHIKSTNPKNINLSDDKHQIMKKIGLQNRKLILMTIELYNKLITHLGEFVIPAAKSQAQKLKYERRVNPAFSVKDIMDNLDTITTPAISFRDNLLTICPPAIPMACTDISLNEFNNSFNNTIIKKDILGINKKILSELPIYLKLRFINAFNKLYNRLVGVNEIAIARGTYMYKVAKKGNASEISSFRPILTLPAVINQFHRILCMRLTTHMIQNNYFDTTIQKGGISGQRFPIFEQVYKIKNVIRDANKNNKSCCILFIDIANAFGTINRDVLYKILKLYHVEQSLIDYIREFYDNLIYFMDLGKTKTEQIKWTNGLVQGCAMSLILFEIALNYVLSYCQQKYSDNCSYQMNNGKKILLTAFVDDICIVCNNCESANTVLTDLIDMFQMLGLVISKEKSAVMSINCALDMHPNIHPTINSTIHSNIPIVTSYKYLGEYISFDNTMNVSYAELIKSLIHRLKIISYKKLNVVQKTNLFELLVLPWLKRKLVMMYDLSAKQKKNIVAIINPYLREWQITKPLEIFCDIRPIINQSTDEVIKSIGLTIDTHTDDMVNMLNKCTNVTYKQIETDTKDDIDCQIEYMNMVADEKFECREKLKDDFDIEIEKVDV